MTRTLRTDPAVASRLYTIFPDACAMVRAWQSAGWSTAARPDTLRAGDALVPPALADTRPGDPVADLVLPDAGSGCDEGR